MVLFNKNASLVTFVLDPVLLSAPFVLDGSRPSAAVGLRFNVVDSPDDGSGKSGACDLRVSISVRVRV